MLIKQQFGTEKDQYIRICNIYDDYFSKINIEDEIKTNPKIVLFINDNGEIIINNNYTVKANKFLTPQYRILTYLYNFHKDMDDDICLLIKIRRKTVCSFETMKISLYIKKTVIRQYSNGTLLSPLFWITETMQELFQSVHEHHTELFNVKNVPVAKIAPIDVIETDYNKHFKCQLYHHQLNNIEWMSDVENMIRNTNDGYVFVNMQNFTKYDGNDELLNDIYCHKYTSRLYNIHAILDNFNPIYRLKLVGGLLCDDVGVGKTATIIGLIVRSKFAKIKNISTTYGTSPLQLKKKMIRPKIQLKTELLPPSDDSASISTDQLNFKDYIQTLNKYHPYYSYPSSRATLIICPRRLAFQWFDEFSKFVKLDLIIYKITTIVELRKYTLTELLNADVILLSTSLISNRAYYEKIATENYVDVSKIYWNRIVLDECHETLDRKSGKKADKQTYNAILQYKAKYKWCLSATPFPHKKHSLESLILFLSNQEEDLCQYKNEGNDGLIVDNVADLVIKDFYQQYVRKNTKESIKAIATIPQYKMENIFLDFTDIEKAIYHQAELYKDEKRLTQICTNILASDQDVAIIGNKVLSLTEINKAMIKHYEDEKNQMTETLNDYQTKEIQDTAQYKTELSALSINSTPIAQNDDEKKKLTNNFKAKIKRIKDNIELLNDAIKKTEQTLRHFTSLNIDQFKDEKCGICNELFKEVVIQPNGYHFCSDCINLLLVGSNKMEYECPLTNLTINKNQLKIMANPYHPQHHKTDYINENEINKFGTKLSKLIDYIQTATKNDLTDKVIVFSQFEAMLKLVAEVLKYNNIGHVQCRGNVHQITKSIREFRRNPSCKVILLSAEHSSSGNNLTEANHIILLDTINHPDWETIEKQAIGRAVRLGQLKPYVNVVRMMIRNTIEETNFKKRIGKNLIQTLT